MLNIYRETMILRTCDCDFTGAWRPSAVLIAMQEAAGAHSDALGCGRDDLLKGGIVWVLNRCEVHMQAYPGVGDAVTVETFPMPLRRWFFPRYYRFLDAEGKEAGCGATLWTLFDIGQRRMVPPGEWAARIPDNSDLTPPMGLPGSVELVEGPEESMTRTPQYFDLDVNGHVNNTRYADWACDALGVDVMRAYQLAAFRVNYDAEIRPEQEITLKKTVNGQQFRVAGYHEGKMHFEVGGDLAPRR